MFSNIPKEVLERLEKNPNVHTAESADFPQGDLDGEHCGPYFKLTTEEDRITIITVPPNDSFDGLLCAAASGRTFLFFTQSKFRVTVKFTNTDDTVQFFELVFNTAEAAFQAYKASCFSDVEAFEKIYYAKTPKEAKEFGNQVKGFKEDVWKYTAPTIVKLIFALKLEQCPEVKDFVFALKAHAAKHNIPFPGNFRVLEAKEDKIYGTGLDNKATVQKIVDSVVAGCAATLHEELLGMEQDINFTGQRYACPLQYPLTGFFPGEDWMGCGITMAIKKYFEVKEQPTDARPSSPKKARTTPSPVAVTRTSSSSSGADKGDEADSTAIVRSCSSPVQKTDEA